MISSPRNLVYLALVVFVASLSTQAQEVRDRQLTPDYDFSTVQSPVDIVAIKFNDKEISRGEKIQGSDEWIRKVSFTLKNVSDEPLAYVSIGFKFPLPNGFVVVTVLNYGVNYSHGESRKQSSPPPIQPGQTQELVFTKERY